MPLSYPILYSLRNCPYAMRARMAIMFAKQSVLLREVVLNNKPNEMVLASTKATVPILVRDYDVNKKPLNVLDESLAIMLWALAQNDPEDLLHKQDERALVKMICLIDQFDSTFKPLLDKYKGAKRYHETTLIEHRQACEVFIIDIEQRLTSHDFIVSTKASLVDIALLPYIRQFARVERQWYLQSPYPKMKQWLNKYLQSPMFTKVMAKYPLWLNNHKDNIFGG